jgi:hypothetical protein
VLAIVVDSRERYPYSANAAPRYRYVHSSASGRVSRKTMAISG